MKRLSPHLWLALGVALATGCGSSADQEDLDKAVARLERAEATVSELEQQAQATQKELVEARQRLKTLEETVAAYIDRQRKDKLELREELAAVMRSNLERFPLDVRLKVRITLQADGPMDEVLTQISAQLGAPIRVLTQDLTEERIPRIWQVDLKVQDLPAEEVLAKIMLHGQVLPGSIKTVSDPRLPLVYVITGEGGDPRKQEILVTTRKRAAQRGKLPDIFKPTPP